MLVIFDCDGVLVDSEIIASAVLAEALKEQGLSLTAEEAAQRYAGFSDEELIVLIEEEIGRRLPDDWLFTSQAELDRRIARDVDPIAGIEAVLDRIDAARAVCSNSPAHRIEAALRRTDLWDRFRPYIYSAPELGRPKPAPDVYLHALKMLETRPEDAVVIEDSPAGVEAARQAGILVIGFVGGAHTYLGHGERLMEAGAQTVVARHADLPATVEALAGWSFSEI